MEAAKGERLLTASSLVNTINKNLAEFDGGEVEIRRVNRATGELYEVESKERDTTMTEADFQMRTAQLARLLAVLSPKEKLEWAADRKAEGNARFNAGHFDAAIQRYLDATVGLDFGSTLEEAKSAREVIQIPVLTNLAACYLEKKQFDKVVQFCSQALQIEPKCLKALVRRARANISLGKLKEAKEDILAAEELQPNSASQEHRSWQQAVAKEKRRRELEKHVYQEAMRQDPQLNDQVRPAQEEKEVSFVQSMRRCCFVLKWKITRFLQFRIDPPVKFE